MTSKKLHYSFLSISLIFSVLMVSDATFVPSKKQVEVVTNFKERISGTGEYYFHNYSVVTFKGEYDIRNELYSKISIGDSICIYRSIITNAKQKIECNFKGIIYSNNLGFSREVVGTVFLCIMICIILSVMFFYEKIDYQPARSNVTFFLIISVFLFFYFHFQ